MRWGRPELVTRKEHGETVLVGSVYMYKTWHVSPIKTSRKPPMIVFGDAIFGKKNTARMNGKGNVLWKKFEQKEKTGEAVAITVDEYNTFKVGPEGLTVLHIKMLIFVSRFTKITNLGNRTFFSQGFPFHSTGLGICNAFDTF